MGSIYALLDPRSGAVRYVGMTVETPERRRNRHIYVSKRRKTHCANWVRSLVSHGLEPILMVIEKGVPSEILAELEVEWIAFFRLTGADLTNHSDGGEGTRGPKSEETRRKISATLKGRPHSTPRGQDWRDKLSASLKGRDNSFAVERAAEKRRGERLSEQTRARMSASRVGLKHSAETRARMAEAQRARRQKEKTQWR